MGKFKNMEKINKVIPTQDLTEDGSFIYGVSFKGSNPTDKDWFQTHSFEAAVKLSKLINNLNK